MDANGRLIEGARQGNVKKVKDALARGADPGHRTDAGETAMHLAAARGDAPMLQLLTGQGKTFVNKPDGEGHPPLVHAAQSGSAQAVAVLLSAGADPNANGSSDITETAIRAAVTCGSLEMVKLLLAAGADPLVRGRMGLTALDRARERRTPEGRMIAVTIERHLASRAARSSPPPGKSRKQKR